MATANGLQPVQEGKTLNIARPTVIQPKKQKIVEKLRIPIYEQRFKGSNIQLRPALSENYEEKRSDKETWWRPYIRETPIPGSYDVQTSDTFLLDLDRSINTYNFKSDGRNHEVYQGRKGEFLMPGASNFKELSDEMPEMTYCFRNTGREGKDILNEGIRDKNINVAPNQYETKKYDSVVVVDPKNKSYTFKSALRRFPTVYFQPKDGPAPGQYNARSNQYMPAISSSFKSSTPRFKTSHTKVPGPGMYEPTFQSPATKTIRKMGRVHGLFFSCSFQK